MKHAKIILSLLVCACAAVPARGQSEENCDPSREWSLKEVVEYALKNSVAINTKEVNVENKSIALQTSQLSRLPEIGGSIGEDLNFGRSQNREGVTVDQSSYNTSINAYASMPVFEGFRINNQIKADKFSLEATRLEMEQAKEDLSLKVVGCFLQVLYNNEALTIAHKQLDINKKLVEDTQKMVDGGTKTASELYNAQSSLAASESKLVEAENSYETSMLDLVQAINYPDIRGFHLQVPSSDSFLSEAYLCLSPADSIYDSYLSRRPGIRAEENKVKMAEKLVKVAEAKYWPSLQFGVNYGTGYFGRQQESVPNFFQQLNYNGQVIVGASLQIPIFSRLSIYNSVRTAKNNVRLQQLSLKQSRLTAVKEVQTAYVNASTSLGKYEAEEKNVSAAMKAFDFEQKKYEAGRSTAYQFDQVRQKYEEASLQLLQAKFNFIFRAKILEFYKGHPLY